MTLSQRDRSGLVTRVEQRLAGRAVSRAAIEAAVDQVIEKLPVPDESAAPDHMVVALTAESMPDLASRARQKLAAAGVEALDSGAATAGRFTVVTLRTHSTHRERLEQLATDLGARLSVVPADGSPVGGVE